MKVNVSQEQAALGCLTMRELRAKFAELFGEATLAGNRTWLTKRILWRMQALALGDLSERARLRAAELANDADLRVVALQTPAPTASDSPPAPGLAPPVAKHGSRHGLPPIGGVLTRLYKGQPIEVRILADGFICQGTHYRSLSAVAKAITGAHWNGRLFFGLSKGGAR
jgi:Protein of unknown function (DUF2924)